MTDNDKTQKPHYHCDMTLDDLVEACSIPVTIGGHQEFIRNLPYKIVDEPRTGYFVYVTLDGTFVCPSCVRLEVQGYWGTKGWDPQKCLHPITYFIAWEDEIVFNGAECPDCGRPPISTGSGPVMTYRPVYESKRSQAEEAEMAALIARLSEEEPRARVELA
jgi:hypothetical protein